MRRLALLLVLLAPGTAEAATVGREGTELVYRSAPGQEDLFEARSDGGELTFAGREGGEAGITPGTGCSLARKIVRCPLDGVTAVRVLARDSDGLMALYGVPVPVAADLGPGSSDFDVEATSLTVMAGAGSDRVSFKGNSGAIDMGPGEDCVEVTVPNAFTGPLAVDGGAGRDVLSVYGRGKPGIALSGGAGDDEINVATTGSGPGTDIACGPGNDITRVLLADRPGDGCAAHVTIRAPEAVSRGFTATLTAPARGTVEFHRPRRASDRGFSLIARGAFDAPAGALRTRLTPTKAGRPWLRRHARPKLVVAIALRSGGDRNEIDFPSRLR